MGKTHYAQDGGKWTSGRQFSNLIYNNHRKTCPWEYKGPNTKNFKKGIQ